MKHLSGGKLLPAAVLFYALFEFHKPTDLIVAKFNTITNKKIEFWEETAIGTWLILRKGYAEKTPPVTLASPV